MMKNRLQMIGLLAVLGYLVAPAVDARVSAAEKSKTITKAASVFPDIPVPVTSFAAAIVGDWLYIYGGHTGFSHSYSNTEQSKTLSRINLKQPRAWESVADGPPLQGLAMVAVGGKLYRMGGFTARNDEGEDHDLWSQSDVASFDPETAKWSQLQSLPEPRSSFDAAVVDGKIYVVGGWQLKGSAESEWLETAYVMDPEAADPHWSPLPKPPFQRRALSLAAHDGKLYVIGGMQQKGGPTTGVDLFDPSKNAWDKGPALSGKPMEGFGVAAFATGGRLYASTVQGHLQRLSRDGTSWETVQQLERARFFHRMLPMADDRLIVVGGASMTVGKYAEVDVIDLE